MNRYLFALIIGTQLAVGASAQESSPLLKPLNELPTLGSQSAAGESKVKKTGTTTASKPEQGKGPTEITSTEGVTFDDKNRVGVFTGNVVVKDPQFNLNSDKLTVFLKKESAKTAKTEPAHSKPGATPQAKPAATPEPSPTSKAKPTDPDSPMGGGLERAIAEGHVVIVQDKPAEGGGEPKHYVGKANKADYDSNTGDIILTGWPQIQQGINTQAATEEGTIMVLNRDGRLKTTGGCHTVIQDQSDAKSK